MKLNGYSMYNIRREEYRNKNSDGINFCVSPNPFKLTVKEKQDIEDIGKAICDYMDCCIELYKNNETVHELLDKGKPENLKNVKDIKYLFLRPDLILTSSGFCICEIETSPFGLGLAEVLNRAYGNEGYDTIVHQNQLKNYIHSKVESSGTIAYSDKVKAFSGQLNFIADQLFSGDGKNWNAKKIDSNTITNKQIYRAFYLNEQFTDKDVAELLHQSHEYIPTSTPQFEEKALLSFIWDNRYTTFLKDKLSNSEFNLLRGTIPKTWILGEEKYVDGGLPENCQDTLSLANLGKSKRKFVLKQSGFTDSSSWGEGVKFLHKIGKNNAIEIIQRALADENHLYVVQEFKKGINVPMSFINDSGVLNNISAKVRITPYYAYIGKDKGKLIAAKVTGCENTEYIHAGTGSINTAVSVDKRQIERD